MDFLHKDKEQFLKAINLAEHQTGVMAQAVEKEKIEFEFLVDFLGVSAYNINEQISLLD